MEKIKLTPEEEKKAREDRDRKRIEEPNSPMVKAMNNMFLDGREQEIVKECYYNIIKLLKKYCDLEEKYYCIVALWVIGTYAHDEFETYPYLYINAVKGSGKTRLLKLISIISNNGKMVGSLTEAVLFRTAKGRTLCIDEFENLGSEGKSNLRELLNSAYKKGMSIERAKKKKSEDGEDYVIESYDVYTSISMANIWGMEEVLGDRCIILILEKSHKEKITKLIEIFDRDKDIIQIKKQLELIKKELCSLVLKNDMAQNWNDFVEGKLKIGDTKLILFFERVDKTGIEGRNLELLLPLYFVSYMIDDKVLDKILIISKEIVKEREEEDYYENRDRILIRFLAEKIKEENLEYLTWIGVSKITLEFKEYLGEEGENLTSQWMGKALKRLKFIKDKKRGKNGIKVCLDIEKIKNKPV